MVHTECLVRAFDLERSARRALRLAASVAAGLVVLASPGSADAGGFGGTIGGHGLHIHASVGHARFVVRSQSSHVSKVGRQAGWIAPWGYGFAERDCGPRAYDRVLYDRYSPGVYGYRCGRSEDCGRRVRGFTLPAGAGPHRSYVAMAQDPIATGAAKGASVSTGMAVATVDAAPSDGWAFLADDRSGEALARFHAEIRRNPQAGLPRLGYALAYARVGDPATAAWAMREAVRVEPEAMRRTRQDSRIQRQLELAADLHREQIAAGNLGRADTAFLKAVFAYLAGDRASAQSAVAELAAEGDRSRSARNLASLVAEAPSNAAAAVTR